MCPKGTNVKVFAARAQRDDYFHCYCTLLLHPAIAPCYIISGDRSNQNPRWTQKPCISLCLRSMFGSDYCDMLPLLTFEARIRWS